MLFVYLFWGVVIGFILILSLLSFIIFFWVAIFGLSCSRVILNLFWKILVVEKGLGEIS